MRHLPRCDREREGQRSLWLPHCEISRGVLGESSKIREELDELHDAETQGAKILIHCELADLYGALEACAKTYGLSMEDLQHMAQLTKNAFMVGER